MTHKDKVTHYHKIVRHLGYGRGLRSNAHLYTEGTINTFSYSGSSMWTLTIMVNLDDMLVGIEVNTKYFDITKQVRSINRVASFSNPITLDEAVKILLDGKDNQTDHKNVGPLKGQ